MRSIVNYIGQALVYAAIMASLGFLAPSPAYQHFPPDHAMIKLTFAHGGKHITDCVRTSREDLKDLAPNMRKQVRCSRDRVAITVQLEIDGKAVYDHTLQPAGLRNDGPSQVYEGFPVTAGKHVLSMRLRDTKRTDGGFDYETTAEVELSPKQLFVIQFRPEFGGFYFN